jgi:hypothetical protein
MIIEENIGGILKVRNNNEGACFIISFKQEDNLGGGRKV